MVLQQSLQLQSLQNSPLAKHSQYSFRHCDLVQLHGRFFVDRSGKRYKWIQRSVGLTQPTAMSASPIMSVSGVGLIDWTIMSPSSTTSAINSSRACSRSASALAFADKWFR